MNVQLALLLADLGNIASTLTAIMLALEVARMVIGLWDAHVKVRMHVYE